MAFNLFGWFDANKTDASAPPQGGAVPNSGDTPDVGAALVEDPAVARQRQQEADQASALAIEERRAAIESESLPLSSVASIHARRHETRTPEVICAEIQSSTVAHDLLTDQHKLAVTNCLAIETDLKQLLDKELYQRTVDFKQLLSKLKLELARAELDMQYDRIDMSFMRRRKWAEQHNCGLPLFALFDVDNQQCLLAVSAYEGGFRSYSLPPLLQTCCSETVTSLASQATLTGWRSAGIRADFVGALPASVRATVRQLGPKLNKLYIAAEAPTWEIRVLNEWACSGDPPLRLLSKCHPIPPSKLLLIGETQGIYWLLTISETISSENFVSKAFADHNK